MDSVGSIKKLQPYWLKLICYRNPKHLSGGSDKGFTLIELIVVIIIIGILSAIAAPSWLAFLNRQRVNAVNDAALNALREAQRDAKRTKLSYSVSFRNDSDGVPQVAVYLAKKPDGTIYAPSGWKKLGENQEMPKGTVLVGTNLIGVNTAGSSLVPLSGTQTQTITFDYQGNLSSEPNQPTLGNKGLIVAVALTQSGFNGTKRCVKVRTLLGSIQPGLDEDCKAN